MYKTSDVVFASECDSMSKLSIIGAINKIENYICDFFYVNKVDGLTLKRTMGCAWMYTKNKVQFYKPIDWNTKFVAKCFVSKITSATIVVDTMFIQNKEIAIYSKTEICLIDLTTNKIKRIDKLNLIKKKMQGLSHYDFEFDRLDTIDKSFKVDELVVKSTSIDYLNHANNVEYVRFILNTYSVEELLKSPIREFEIHYLGQAKENELLLVLKQRKENTDYLTITHDDKTYIKCKITKEKNNE